MENFKIVFSRPWLLLLLIPALAIAFLPHFLSKRKYRRNRNRIISLSLHTLVSLLCVFLIAGITFTYNVPNSKNEILLLVDCSHSGSEQRNAKDEFVRSIVDECNDEFKVGIVKFGYGQLYVAPLSSDSSDVYNKYLASQDPDASATDMASALKYAQTLFSNPESGKIVLISDGLETDGKADSVIKSVAADGIKVDTVHVPNAKHGEAQIVGVKTPDYNINIGDKFNIELTVISSVKSGENEASVTVYDTVDGAIADEAGKEHSFTLAEGTQTVKIEHSFDVPGLHKLCFKVKCPSDTLAQNNTYYTYIRILTSETVLIIEKDEGEAEPLRAMLSEDYEVNSLSLEQDMASLPKTVAELCEYRQIILANISNGDLAAISRALETEKGYDELLDEYVRVEGGGLLTVGGRNDEDNTPHAYNRDDMLSGGTLYGQMLPVQVLHYTPPVAVMIVIDSSGSMGTGENSAMHFAKQGAKTVFDVLNPRDYCGVMTLKDTASELLAPTQVSHKSEIEAAINRITAEGDGGTMYSAAIERAGMVLSGVNIQQKHIILVTDGEPNDKNDFQKEIELNRENGVTMSIVVIKNSNSSYDAELMQKAAELGGGTFYETDKVEAIATNIQKDLSANAVAEIEYGKPFSLYMGDMTPTLAGITQEELPSVYGYYGTRAKEGADVPLWCGVTPTEETQEGNKAASSSQRVPMYAQWKYGEGTVGSFMCTVSGEWSKDFMSSPAGERFIRNAVTGLFPTKDIRKSEIKAVLREDNYTNRLSVYAEKQEGDRIEVSVTPVTEEAKDAYRQNPIVVTASDENNSFTFAATVPGIYEITVSKISANGDEPKKVTLYKALSYSREYDMFPEIELDGAKYLANLATDGRGAVVENVFDVFDSFVKLQKREYNPRIPFLILAIVAFLLDVAVRKFKIKWPHELVRDYKEKKALKENRT